MSLTQMGDKTKSLFLKGIENHKLHQAFEVADGETIKKGQPVKLNANGEAVPAADGDAANLVIGYSIHDGTAEQVITVGMKPFLIVWAMPNAAVDAGPVAYNGQNTEDGAFGSYKAATPANNDQVGYALDPAGAANEVIRVALF